MAHLFLRALSVASLGLALISQSAAAFQRGTGSGGTNRTGGNSNIPPPNLPVPDTAAQPTFLSGKVLFVGGGAPSEPVAIERLCNGAVRREGYTDSNGHFQFQVGQNVGFHDASESSVSQFPSDRPNSQRQGPELRRLQLQGCELRASLAGFQSSTVPIRPDASSWQIEVEAIFLKRMENVTGATISLTTISAPKEARQAYEKAQKAFGQNKLAEAEKGLEKAVTIYPNFATAWSLLGDLHARQNRFDQALKEYSQAVLIDAQFVNPNFGLAIIAVQEKRWLDAVQLTNHVTKMNAFAYPSAYFYNAVANYYLERLDAAEESAKKFKSLDTDHHHPDVALLLGDIRIRKNDYAGAAREMRDYLAIAPNAPDAEQIRAKAQKFEDIGVNGKQ
ncbi:MAG TPA: tetratricopeptide repeat protein [Candidatus Saccharimonadales bacterium]|nr:tetratricopeptide repeat protein [Candidatus Saccharimonadales bacterium]